MGKKRALSQNMILFAISSFGTKFLSFILVPFYTNYLSTSEYGTIDLVINTAALLLPVFTLTVYDGVLRFTLSDKNNSGYFYIGLRITIIGSVLLAFLLICVGMIFPISMNGEYLIWIWCIYACNAVYSLVSNYLRAIDMVTVMVHGSIVNSFLLLMFNIVFISYLHIGVRGYFLSTLIGLSVSCLYMIIRCIISKKMIKTDSFTFGSGSKELLRYTIPLIFTAIAWWINSSLDRYFVTWICGVEENGIYSVAYKIPSILTACQSIFIQAWSITAVTDFNAEDNDGFMGHTYEVFNILMILICMVLMLLNIPLSQILYAKNFFEAWRYVPFLLSSTLFGALAGYYGGIFSAVKDSKICAISTIAGAISNTILNTLLIPLFHVSGAACATLIAYMFSWIIRAIAAKKYINLKLHKKSLLVSYILLIIMMICAISENKFYPIQIAIIIVMIFVFRMILKVEVRKFLLSFKYKLDKMKCKM